MVQHPDENADTSIYDYLKGKVKRDFWIIPYEKFTKQINKKKN